MGNLDGKVFGTKKLLLIISAAKKPPFIKPVFQKAHPRYGSGIKKYEGKYRWLNQVSWESYNEKRKTSNFLLRMASKIQV
jgi:hypothetical protein